MNHETENDLKHAILIELLLLIVFAGVAFYVYSAYAQEGGNLQQLLLLFAALALSMSAFAWRRTQEMTALMEKVRVESVIDALTAVYNRTYMQQVLRIEAERAQRSNSALSVMLIDIDNLGEINEKLGHEGGDRAVLAFSGILTHKVRKVDAVGRWAGGTFMILCPDTKREGAMVAAERVLASVREALFEGGTLRGSIGLTELQSEEDIDDCIQRAQQALADAKAQGKDRVAAV